jgi:phosphopantothenoylcysteine decarboxylase/phosphopantothenate--cysteine ligase
MRQTALRFLVSAGPTREHIDDVRFLSNASSGRMGYAVAAAAAGAGHRVVVVTGTTDLDVPRGVERVRVVSAADMLRAMTGGFGDADAVVMTAAVCDYRPARRARGKTKKTGAPHALRLRPTTDILETLGRRKRSQILVGFCLSTGDLVAEAAAKCARKRCDLMVANGPDALGRRHADVWFVEPDGTAKAVCRARKSAIATRIVRRVEALAARGTAERRRP